MAFSAGSLPATSIRIKREKVNFPAKREAKDGLHELKSARAMCRAGENVC